MKVRFLIISGAYQFLNQVSSMFCCRDMLDWSFSEFSTLAKLKMPISQQWNMIETSFKNWHVQKNHFYQLRNMGRGAIRAGVLIMANTVIGWAYPFLSQVSIIFHCGDDMLLWLFHTCKTLISQEQKVVETRFLKKLVSSEKSAGKYGEGYIY